MSDIVSRINRHAPNSNDGHLRGVALDARNEIIALRARLAEVEKERDAAIVALCEQARKRGEAEGRLQASELPGIVEGWKSRAERAEAALATARRDAIDAVKSQRIANPCEPIDMHDAGYNAAIDDAVDAIRALANEAET